MTCFPPSKSSHEPGRADRRGARSSALRAAGEGREAHSHRHARPSVSSSNLAGVHGQPLVSPSDRPARANASPQGRSGRRSRSSGRTSSTSSRRSCCRCRTFLWRTRRRQLMSRCLRSSTGLSSSWCAFPRAPAANYGRAASSVSMRITTVRGVATRLHFASCPTRPARRVAEVPGRFSSSSSNSSRCTRLTARRLRTTVRRRAASPSHSCAPSPPGRVPHRLPSRADVPPPPASRSLEASA